jgi:hypothetical protein
MTPSLLVLFSFVTVLALLLSQGGQMGVPVTARYGTAEPTFVDRLALVRRHLWHTWYVMNSAAKPEFGQFPRESFERLLLSLPVTASLAKFEWYGYCLIIIGITSLDRRKADDTPTSNTTFARPLGEVSQPRTPPRGQARWWMWKDQPGNLAMEIGTNSA